MLNNYIAIALRITAIIFFFRGLKEFVAYIQYELGGTYSGLDISVWPFLFVAMIIWSFSYIAWFFAVPISKILVPENIDFRIEAIPPISLIAIFVAAIGLFVTVYSLIDAFYYLTLFLISQETGSVIILSETLANVIATAFEFTLGIMLLIKARSVASLINKVAK